MDVIYLAAALLVVAALALSFFTVRFWTISPQMRDTQSALRTTNTELQATRTENRQLSEELQKTRAENLKLQEELRKTRVSLDSCTTALNDQ